MARVNQVSSWALGFALVLAMFVPESSQLKSHLTTRRSHRVRRSSGDFLDAAQDLDQRIDLVLSSLKLKILVALDSVEKDIAIANRDRVILGLSNFLGMAFGIAAGAKGNANFGELNKAEKIQVVAQAFYGYGYWGPFLLEFEPARLTCGRNDLETALFDFRFVTDMNHNFGFLDNFVGSKPRGQLTVANDPVILQYYTVEFNHAMKRELYCIVKRAGSNQDALEVTTFIDLYTQLITERLSMTNSAMFEFEEEMEDQV